MLGYRRLDMPFGERLGRSKSPQPLSEYDFCLLCIKVFSDLFQSHVADKFKFSTKTCRYPADMVEYLSYGLRSVKIK